MASKRSKQSRRLKQSNQPNQPNQLSQSNQSGSAPPPASFLGLPRELRDVIYKYLLYDRYDIHIKHRGIIPFVIREGRAPYLCCGQPCLKVRRTCRAVQTEMDEIISAFTILQVYNDMNVWPDTGKQVRTALPRLWSKLVRFLRLEVSLDGFPRQRADWDWLHAFGSLEKVEFGVLTPAEVALTKRSVVLQSVAYDVVSHIPKEIKLVPYAYCFPHLDCQGIDTKVLEELIAEAGRLRGSSTIAEPKGARKGGIKFASLLAQVPMSPA